MSEYRVVGIQGCRNIGLSQCRIGLSGYGNVGCVKFVIQGGNIVFWEILLKGLALVRGGAVIEGVALFKMRLLMRGWSC